MCHHLSHHWNINSGQCYLWVCFEHPAQHPEGRMAAQDHWSDDEWPLLSSVEKGQKEFEWFQEFVVLCIMSWKCILLQWCKCEPEFQRLCHIPDGIYMWHLSTFNTPDSMQMTKFALNYANLWLPHRFPGILLPR